MSPRRITQPAGGRWWPPPVSNQNGDQSFPSRPTTPAPSYHHPGHCPSSSGPPRQTDRLLGAPSRSMRISSAIRHNYQCSVWARLSAPRCAAVEIALGRLGDWREDKGGGCGGDCLQRTASSPAASPCQQERAPRHGDAQHKRGSAAPVMPDAITRVDRRWEPPQRHTLTLCQHSRTGTFDTGKSSSHCQRQSTSSAVL